MQGDREVLLSHNRVEGKLSLHEETDCGDGVKRTELHLDALFNVTITGVESTRIGSVIRVLMVQIF